MIFKNQIKEILKELKIEYKEIDQKNIYIEDIDGDIFELDNFIYFVHGNTEPRIEKNNPQLKEWVVAYLNGFDEFDNFIKKLNQPKLKTGEKINLIAIHFNEDTNQFIKKNIIGTVEDEGSIRGKYINFDERTFDHFGAYENYLGKVQEAEEFGVDYDAVFILSEKDIPKAQEAIFELYKERLKEAEDILADYVRWNRVIQKEILKNKNSI